MIFRKNVRVTNLDNSKQISKQYCVHLQKTSFSEMQMLFRRQVYPCTTLFTFP